MKRCPITYDIISDQENYSQRGLRQLSPHLVNLQPLDLSAEEPVSYTHLTLPTTPYV